MQTSFRSATGWAFVMDSGRIVATTLTTFVLAGILGFLLAGFGAVNLARRES